jgi:hypothetical protein
MTYSSETSSLEYRNYAPSSLYVSGDDVKILLALLAELRDVTLSRGSYLHATSLISKFDVSGAKQPQSEVAVYEAC